MRVAKIKGSVNSKCGPEWGGTHLSVSPGGKYNGPVPLEKGVATYKPQQGTLQLKSGRGGEGLHSRKKLILAIHTCTLWLPVTLLAVARNWKLSFSSVRERTSALGQGHCGVLLSEK